MCHVLVIEDELLVALQIEAVLRENGATSVDLAATKREALRLAKEKPPKLITSDVRLADGTGPIAVVEIIATLGLIPTIFITGTPQECEPCDPPHRVHEKPLEEHALGRAFREMAFDDG